MGTERRRRRMRRPSRAVDAVREPAPEPAAESDGAERGARGVDPAPALAAPRSPTPHDLAERGGTFAMTAEVLDPAEEPEEACPPGRADARSSEWTGDEPTGHGRLADDPHAERGLRGLVGGGSSQVSVGAALRARDAARPTEDDLAAAEAELVIVRRRWVPREDLPPRGPRR